MSTAIQARAFAFLLGFLPHLAYQQFRKAEECGLINDLTSTTSPRWKRRLRSSLPHTYAACPVRAYFMSTHSVKDILECMIEGTRSKVASTTVISKLPYICIFQNPKKTIVGVVPPKQTFAFPSHRCHPPSMGGRPNTGSRESWVAGEACSRTVNPADLMERGKPTIVCRQ